MPHTVWTLAEFRATAVAAHQRGWRIVGTHESGELEITCQSITELYSYPNGIQIALGMAGTWLECGAPSVTMSSPIFETLIKATPDTRPVLPWPAWLIILPKSKHTPMFLSSANQWDPVQMILCYADFTYDRVTFLALSKQVEFVRVGLSLEDLRDNIAQRQEDLFGAESQPIVDRDHASCAVIGRLILRICAALFELTGIERVGMERPAQIIGRLPAGDYVLL